VGLCVTKAFRYKMEITKNQITAAWLDVHSVEPPSIMTKHSNKNPIFG